MTPTIKPEDPNDTIILAAKKLVELSDTLIGQDRTNATLVDRLRIVMVGRMK